MALLPRRRLDARRRFWRAARRRPRCARAGSSGVLSPATRTVEAEYFPFACIKTLYRTAFGRRLHKNALSDSGTVDSSSILQLHFHESAYSVVNIRYYANVVAILMSGAGKVCPIERFYAAHSKSPSDRTFLCMTSASSAHRLSLYTQRASRNSSRKCCESAVAQKARRFSSILQATFKPRARFGQL